MRHINIAGICLVSLMCFVSSCYVRYDPAFYCKCIQTYDTGSINVRQSLAYIKSDKVYPDAAIAKQCADTCRAQQRDSFVVQCIVRTGAGTSIGGRTWDHEK